MALTDPVPSQAIDVFKKNMEDVDSVVNNTSGTVTNRTGKTMRPLPVISDDIESQIAALEAEIVNVTDNAANAFGFRPVGLFADGFTINYRNEVGIDGGGNSWIYNGTLPFTVTAGTVPSAPDYQQVTFNSIENLDWQTYNSDAVSVSQGGNSGGVYLILDDANATTINDIIPAVAGRGFKFGLAPYLFGIAASYNFVRLSQMLDIKKANKGEILSHSSYHTAHDATLDTSTGESYISAAAQQFNQFGFSVNGFVAPNSTLDDKFRPVLEANHDYAFIRSVAVTTNEAATNSAYDDVYNMVRVNLELITEQQAKDYVDYAVSSKRYLVFYTHTNVAYLSNLITYIQNSGAENINPAEWVGRTKGLTKGNYPTSSENLIRNTELKKARDTDVNPTYWTTDFTDIPAATLSVISGTPNRFDLAGTALNAAESLVLRQNIPTGAINRYTPFCFSGRFTSSNSNSELKLAIYLKDSGNTTIVSAQKTIDLNVGEQLVSVAEGFIPNATASYVQVEITLTSKASGQIRCLGTNLKAEYSGKPTQHDEVKAILDNYYSVLRRTTGLTVQSDTDTDLVFNASLEGTNLIYDTTSGVMNANFGVYDISGNFGLQSMNAGDLVTIYLKIDGTVARKCNYVCAAGTNIFNPSWTVRGDGKDYQIGIRHNSGGGRALTTFSDSLLTISGKS